jgi:ribosomal protein S18 acetylase RimI-like enzyme
MIVVATPAEEQPVPPKPHPAFVTHLASLLGSEPSQQDWPVEFALPPGDWTSVFDRTNALLTVCGVRATDLADPALDWLAAGPPADEPLCSRLLVITADTGAAAWRALGFSHEGTVAGYWEQSGPAQFWARMTAARAADPPSAALAPFARTGGPSRLPTGWTCRPAEAGEAAEITDLVRRVFSGYPVPADPGAVRYALASGTIHGRVIRDGQGLLCAYATLEFQPGDGAAEITDCATVPACRGRGLMAHLVGALQRDQFEVFGSRHVYALAREDQPAMQRVLAGLGWRRVGRLVNHFRLGEPWVSAVVWEGRTR